MTGAASGMGRAEAHLFADEGASVALLDRDGDGVRSVAAEIAAIGGTAIAIEVDLADAEAIDAAVATARAELGPIDIVVNNAGVSIPAPVAGDDYESAWRTTLAVNLDAQHRVIRACLDDLARDGSGRIVNIASTEGLGATPGLSPYTASKHGVIGLTKALAVELGRRGITVNCVCPGPIRTGMTAPIPDDAKDRFARRRVPLGRYGDPEEVAHIVLGMVLPASAYLNGAVVTVDGGMTAQNV